VSSVEQSKRFQREVNIWSRLNHENILPFLGLVDLFLESNEAQKGLISPWMQHGNCIDYLNKYPDANRLPLIRGIVSGLAYLHHHDPPVIHGDLRGMNVLISNEGIPLLSDFGLAVIAEELTQLPISTVLTGAGNCRWMSYELLFCDAVPSKESDIWALGMVIIELLTRRPPFAKLKKDAQVILALSKHQRPAKPNAKSNAIGFSNGLWRFVNACWSDDPHRRPDVNKVVGLLDGC